MASSFYSNSGTASSTTASVTASKTAAEAAATNAAASASAAQTAATAASNNAAAAGTEASKIIGLNAATGAAGSNASYNNSTGVLTVPRGNTGATGAAGPAGASITGPTGPQGPQGAAFTYSDFTSSQLTALTGPTGPAGASVTGPTGLTGPQGAAFTYSDFTSSQLAALTGPTGPAGAAGDGGYQEITVTVAISNFAIDGTENQTITLVPSVTYRIDQSHSSNSGHPFLLATSADGTTFSTGVTVSGTAGNSGAYVEIKLEQDAPTLYYKCGNHSGYGGSISKGGSIYSVGDGGLTQNNFTNADHTKLDGIETSATADQTDAEIKTAYENNSNTNAFTDALQTKLNAIEASADVTDSTNVVAALTAGTNITIAADGTIAATSGSVVNGTSNRYEYVVGTNNGSYTNGSTTVFPAVYSVDSGVAFADVYLNGTKLIPTTDFTASNGTSITLGSAASTGDFVSIVAYGTFSLATQLNNHLPLAGGTMTGDIVFNSGQTFDGIDVSALNTTVGTKATSANPVFTGAITEQVYTLSGTALDPANGTIQTKALSGTVGFTDALTSGESMVLQVTGGASATAVSFPTMTWVTSAGNAAPTLTAADTIVFWKVATTLYGAYAGSSA